MAETPTTCNQNGCVKPPAFRFTWPGRDEAGICADHAVLAAGIAAAIGVHLQMIPLEREPAAALAPHPANQEEGKHDEKNKTLTRGDRL